MHTEGKKILLVEDDPKLRYVLHTLLEQRGCQVKVCEDAECARKIDGDHYDTAILDVRLPLELGTDLAGFLSRKHPDLRIIFITGYDNLERFEHRLDGAKVLIKPFAFDALWGLL